MIRIALLRHGKTNGNTVGKYIGVTDEPLCEEGIRQLTDRGMGTVELVFVSPLTRCIQSAELLYPYARKIKMPEFRECNFGDFENKNYIELQNDPRYQAWVDSMATLAFPNGEDPEDFKQRCVAGFDKMIDTCIRRHYQNVACVVHGGTIMSIMEKYGIPARDYFGWQVPNGCGYNICISERNWKMGRREAFMDAEIQLL